MSEEERVKHANEQGNERYWVVTREEGGQCDLMNEENGGEVLGTKV